MSGSTGNAQSTELGIDNLAILGWHFTAIDKLENRVYD
jgi:hypothetical protein